MNDDLRAVVRRLPVLDPRKACATPKPDKFARKAKERQEKREHGDKRSRLRRQVFFLDECCCRRCGRRVYLKEADAPTALAIAHVDEWVPRSAGGDDLDPLNCLTYCAECHLLGKHRQGEESRWFVPVAVDPLRLMRGPVEFITPAPILIHVPAQTAVEPLDR